MSSNWFRIVVLVCVVGLLVSCSPLPSNLTKEEKRLLKQIHKLSKLKCKPRSTKVYLHDLPGGEAELKDFIHEPHVISVKRCDPSCSYCGDYRGIETALCVPVDTKRKTFYYITNSQNGGKEIKSIEAEEHKRCACEHQN